MRPFFEAGIQVYFSQRNTYTPRQQEINKMLEEGGLSSTGMAQRLGISVRTVESHRAMMRARNLGVEGLTPREREVMRLRGSMGLSYREVGQKLDISDKTVRIYSTLAFRKLGVRSMIQAAAILGPDFFENKP